MKDEKTDRGGRPERDTVPLTLRVAPSTKAAFMAEANDAEMTLGDFFEAERLELQAAIGHIRNLQQRRIVLVRSINSELKRRLLVAFQESNETGLPPQIVVNDCFDKALEEEEEAARKAINP